MSNIMHVFLKSVIKLCLSICVRFFPFLKCRCENTALPMHCDLHMFKFMIMFTSCLTNGEDHGWALDIPEIYDQT
jgi:hypothetical protein